MSMKKILRFIRSETNRINGIVAQQRQIVSGILDAIKSYVPKVQSAWIGGDADAFAADVFRKLVPAMMDLIAAIGGINLNLSKSIEAIDQADRQVQQLAGGVKDTFSKIFSQ
jgi:uncharacterized protein YukE